MLLVFFSFYIHLQKFMLQKCTLKYKMDMYTFWDALDDPICIQDLAKFRSVAQYRSRCSSLIFLKDNTSSIVTRQYGQVIISLARYFWVGNIFYVCYLCSTMLNLSFQLCSEQINAKHFRNSIYKCSGNDPFCLPLSLSRLLQLRRKHDTGRTCGMNTYLLWILLIAKIFGLNTSHWR